MRRRLRHLVSASARRLRHLRANDVRYMLMMLAALVAAYAAFAAHSAADRANRDVQHQTENRARNVGVWCGAINRQAAILNGYVAAIARRDPHVPPLSLAVLPCKLLEAVTRASAR